MILQSHSWAYIWRKLLIQKDTCTPTFVAVLFTIAKIQKQPKCPSTDEWIKKMWYTHTHTHTHTMEYQSAIKKNETMPFAAAWMDLEKIISSEVSQTEKDNYHITSMWNLKKMIQINKTEKDSQTQKTNL